MKWKQLRKLSKQEFKRLVGVNFQTFQIMLKLVKKQEKRNRKLKKNQAHL